MSKFKTKSHDGIRLPDQILVAAYTRVSTDSEDQLKSFEAQKNYFNDYCNDKDNLFLYKVYADEGLSGTNPHRESFLQMIWDAGIDYVDKGYKQYEFTASKTRKPEFSIILVKDASRFARDQKTGSKLAEELRKKKVFLIIESSGLSTMDSDWEMRLFFLFQFGEEESRNLSKRVKWGKERRKNIYNPSRMPYGFERDENKQIVIVPNEAEVIREIYERIKFEGTLRITKDLNLRGIPTKTGKKWSMDKVARIVRNSIYYGTAVKNKYTRYSITDSQRTVRDQEDWHLIENAVIPIVSKEILLTLT